MKELSLEELKNVELKLLKSIDSFCNTNGVKYFIHAGSLLGAVRHKGFIPWDDDIDISMSRVDYNRFKELTLDANCPFGFNCFERDEKYPYVFGKIYDKETLLIENDREGNPIGVYIDVFPLDLLPNDKDKAVSFVKKCHTLTWIQMMASDKKIRRAKTFKRQIIKVFLSPISKIIGYRYLTSKLNKKVQKYNNIQTQYISNLVSPNYMHVYEKKWFDSVVRIPFESIEVNAPCGYLELLKNMYGDYMKLPPVEKQKTHHDFKAYKL